MKTITQIHEVTPEQFKTFISEQIKAEIEALKHVNKEKAQEVYLTRYEVSKLLKINISTLHNWTKSGKLTRYCIGNRVYYKRSDIERALVKI